MVGTGLEVEAPTEIHEYLKKTFTARLKGCAKVAMTNAFTALRNYTLLI
jgi:hypothetical protein